MGVEGIGNNILKLRKKKGVTQEVLAEFIGVTKTSVSKWETGATMPDIQMLPLLASYFEVSVDELIDYVPALSREQIRFHYQRLAEAFGERPFGEVLEECEGMIRKYYSCYSFLHQMVVLLLNHQGVADTEQNRDAIVKMTLDLCEHILADCKDVRICKNVIGLRGMLNLMQGKAELVLEEIGEESLKAEYMGNEGTLLTMAYLMTGDSEKAGKAAQIGLYRSLMAMIDYGIFLLQATKKDAYHGCEVLKRMDRIVEAFRMLSLSPNTVGKYEYQAAVYLAGKLAGAQVEKSEGSCTAGLEDTKEIEEEIFRRLEGYASACRQLFADGIKLHGDSFFTHLDDWFEEMELGKAGVRSSGSIREDVLQSFQNPVFAALEDKERLQKLVRRWEEEIALCAIAY